MRVRAMVLAMAAVVGFAACEDEDDVITVGATLSGANENPANASTATGGFSAAIDENNVMSYTLSYSGLGSNVTMAHIHGPAAPGSPGPNVGVLLDFNADGRTIPLSVTQGTATGTVNLNTVVLTNINVDGDSLRTLLLTGNAYVNVHTVNLGGGEIRGQITRQN